MDRYSLYFSKLFFSLQVHGVAKMKLIYVVMLAVVAGIAGMNLFSNYIIASYICIIFCI